MEKLKKYESPEMEIILIENIDVITASTVEGGSGSGGGSDWETDDGDDW